MLLLCRWPFDAAAAAGVAAMLMMMRMTRRLITMKTKLLITTTMRAVKRVAALVRRMKATVAGTRVGFAKFLQ